METQPANGLRTYRPSLANLSFSSPALEQRVTSWIDGVRGQGTSVSRALLLAGEPGLGKTTLALALCNALGVAEQDIREVNCANTRTLDDARDLLVQMSFLPTQGHYRVLILDEVHQMVLNAQKAFLTPIEKLHQQTLLIACTSEPSMLDEAFLSRFYRIDLDRYPDEVMADILMNLPKPPSPKLVPNIIAGAGGNVRRALALIEGGAAVAATEAMSLQQAGEGFVRLLFHPQLDTVKLYQVSRMVPDKDRKAFYDRILPLIEGVWLTRNKVPIVMAGADQKILTDVCANEKASAALAAWYYRELLELSEKPTPYLKVWAMGLSERFKQR